MTLYKSNLGKRIIALAVQIGIMSDDARARAGDMAQLAEDFEDERKLCQRCGTALDAQGRCAACFESDMASGTVDEEGGETE